MPPSKTVQSTSAAGARRRLKLLLFVVVLFLSWAAYIMFTQYGQMNVRASQLQEAEQKLTDALTKSETLKQEIVRLNDDEYISQIARKEQGYIYPGETPIHIEKKDP